MRKAIIFIIVFSIIFSPLALFSVPLNSSAYISSSNFFLSRSSSSSVSFKPSHDGIYLLQSTYKSYYSPDTINSPSKLSNFYFTSGTYNGQPVSELSSMYLSDLEIAGFSQVVSYTDEGDYFVYSLLTCIPVKANDYFSLSFPSNTSNVRESSSSILISSIPGGSGCRLVHNEKGTSHPENPLTYTVKSKNQHLVSVLNPDSFSSGDGFFSSVFTSSSFDGLASIGGICRCADFFTTSYEYTGDISVTLKDSVDSYAFAVYEIFTDGTLTPGFNTEGEQSTTETTPVSVDLSEVLQRLIEIRQSIDDKVIEVTVSVSDAVHEKLDAILDALANLPADMWDSFKVGLSDMFRIENSPTETTPSDTGTSATDSADETVSTTTEIISLEIDQENFDNVMEEVDIDKLGSNIIGPTGSISFFWYVVDKFLDNTGLYIAVYLSLFLAFCSWLLRS